MRRCVRWQLGWITSAVCCLATISAVNAQQSPNYPAGTNYPAGQGAAQGNLYRLAGTGQTAQGQTAQVQTAQAVPAQSAQATQRPGGAVGTAMQGAAMQGAAMQGAAGQNGYQAGANPGYQGQPQAGAQAGQMQAGQMQGQPQPGQAGGANITMQREGVQAIDPNGVVNIVAPFPPLNKDWQDYLDKALALWEEKSGAVQRYECTFKRFQYDPTLTQEHAYTVAAGVLKYLKPDKGLFKVEQLVYYKGLDKEQKPQYLENPDKQFGEYLICDGKYVHEMDQNQKKCIKRELPPQMQGNAIHLSPLPFLFGVKAAEVQTRYWIRPLAPPEGRKNEVWLEAYPRRADDAANYQRVQVVIDINDWMPKALIVYLPNWRPNAPHRELYEFENRQINAGSGMLQKLNPFQQEFIPSVPADWKVIVEPFQSAPPEQEPRVATPPANAPTQR